MLENPSGMFKLTGCRAASRPIEYSGVVLLTIILGLSQLVMR